MTVQRAIPACRVTAVLLIFCVWLFASAADESVEMFSKSHRHVRYCDKLPGKVLDCSNRKLRDIPNSTFPKGLLKLDLSQNALTKVHSGTFRKQTSLLRLDLSRNNITRLGPGVFKGLNKLRYLSLRSNCLNLTSETYTKTLMKDLVSLTVLRIDGNINKKKSAPTGRYSCPIEAFNMLQNLRKLYTDIPREIEIGSCFGGLPKLETLSSGGTWDGCLVKNLTNSTFERFHGKLRELRLIYCGIQRIEPGVFVPLKHLAILDLTYNADLTLSQAFVSLYGLQNRSMNQLILRHVNTPYQSTPINNFEMSGTSTRYLKTICVRHLDISSNDIFFIDEQDVPILGNSSCLEEFYCRKHSLRFVPIKFMMKNLINSKVLKVVDVSGGFSHQSDKDLLEEDNVQLHTDSTGQDFTMKVSTIIVTTEVEWLNISNLVRWITLEWLQENLMQHVNARNLRVLDASSNSITGCDSLVSGFDELLVLNISGSDCSEISPKMFSKFRKLRKLIFRNSRLNVGFENYGKGDVFHSLVNLLEIDLSQNDFLNIHLDIFNSLPNLSKVLLQGNKFENVPFACLRVRRLQYLDISDNVISKLEERERNQFDTFAMTTKANNTNFSLILAGNPLDCTCDTRDFVDWIFTTHVDIIYNDRLRCTLSNGSIVTLESLKEVWAELRITCESMFWLSLAISGLLLMLMTIFLGALGYRNRWHLRYWFRTFCRHDYEPIPENFDYDGFVCYNHEDYKWVVHRLRAFLEDERNGYKLCLHHRDFPAGQAIQQNIVDAINISRKIILVITEKFIQCDWGEYEIEMAGMRSVRDGSHNLIIAILLEDMPVSKMPKVVLNLWHRITFLTWPHTRREQASFWKRLQKAMK